LKISKPLKCHLGDLLSDLPTTESFIREEAESFIREEEEEGDNCEHNDEYEDDEYDYQDAQEQEDDINQDDYLGKSQANKRDDSILSDSNNMSIIAAVGSTPYYSDSKLDDELVPSEEGEEEDDRDEYQDKLSNTQYQQELPSASSSSSSTSRKLLKDFQTGTSVKYDNIPLFGKRLAVSILTTDNGTLSLDEDISSTVDLIVDYFDNRIRDREENENSNQPTKDTDELFGLLYEMCQALASYKYEKNLEDPNKHYLLNYDNFINDLSTKDMVDRMNYVLVALMEILSQNAVLSEFRDEHLKNLLCQEASFALKSHYINYGITLQMDKEQQENEEEGEGSFISDIT